MPKKTTSTTTTISREGAPLVIKINNPGLPASKKSSDLGFVKNQEPEITRRVLLSCQACVPKEWTDEQVIEFAEKENPCGTEKGWSIRKEGDKLLNGDKERSQCQGKDRENFVHIMLDA